jgi:hypothetical protein
MNDKATVVIYGLPPSPLGRYEVNGVQVLVLNYDPVILTLPCIQAQLEGKE